MAKTQDELSKKAEATFALLLDAIREISFLESIVDTYQKLSEQTAGLDTSAKRLATEDLNRVVVEMLLFSVYHIIGYIAPKYVTCDSKRMDYYATGLIEYLQAFIREFDVHENVIEFNHPKVHVSVGQQISAPERLANYFKGSMEDTLRYFGFRMGVALDPENYLLGELIGWAYAPILVDLANTVTKHVFGKD